jgi:glycosyltransferase involved in cell wall biosynthesis
VFWPKISIVTVSYNQGRYLETAIQSIVFQRYPNLEYIIIDGGSTDGSFEILEKYREQLAYVSSEPDNGPVPALKKGFQRATGEILAFLNADDFYLPGTLHRMARLFRENPSADVIYGDGYMADASGQLRKPMFSDSWNLYRVAFGVCMVIQPATFFRQKAFVRTNGFNEEFSCCWDAALWTDLALSGARFHHAKEPFAVFRMHPDSITGSGRLQQQSVRDMDTVFHRIMKRPKGTWDRVLMLLFRMMKFSLHPRRSLGYKRFIREVRSET